MAAMATSLRDRCTTSGSEEDESDEDSEYSRQELLSSNPFTLKNFSKRKLRYMALFDVECWVAELQNFTFPTVFAAIDWSEGVAVEHFFREGVCKQANKVSDDDELSLEALREKIDRLMSQLAPAQCFFVRLGPRSPKDAPVMATNLPPDIARSQLRLCGFSDDHLRQALEEYARSCAVVAGGKEDGIADVYEVLRSFQDVSFGLMRVSSSEEALRLLLSSSRVAQDLSRTLDQGKGGWQMSLAVRQWDADVRLEREFRTFVVAGEVVAISQYDDQLAYQFVLTSNHAELIVGAIVSGMREAKTQLEALDLMAPIVVDFLVIPPGHDSELWRSRIIELNPFGPMTGASLFHWTTDRRLLQGCRDIFGDLDDWELKHPTGSMPLPPHVRERTILGVPFRYNVAQKPGFTWEHLQAYWEDYLRLSPPSLLAKRPC